MTTAVSPQAAAAQAVVLPKNRGAYYAGAWHEPKAGRFVEIDQPGHWTVFGEGCGLRRGRHRRRRRLGKDCIR